MVEDDDKSRASSVVVDHPDGAPVAKVKPNLVCTPVGVSSMVSNVAKELVQAWNLLIKSSDSSTDVGCSTTSDSDDESVTSEEEGDTSFPWGEWETFCEGVGSARRASLVFLYLVY